MEPKDILTRVQDILRTEFPPLKRLELADDTPLISSGLLDSFAIVTLISALEEAYGFDLDVEDIDVSAFETPAAIAELCRRSGA